MNTPDGLEAQNLTETDPLAVFVHVFGIRDSKFCIGLRLDKLGSDFKKNLNGLGLDKSGSGFKNVLIGPGPLARTKRGTRYTVKFTHK